MKLHIATVGKDIGHVLASFKHYPIDQLLLISSENFETQALDVKGKLSEFGVHTDVTFINPFTESSYTEIIESIINYINAFKEKPEVFINITGGTNLMSSASLTAAHLIGANAYYVMRGESDSKFLDVPILKISFENSLSDKQKIIFKLIHREIGPDGKINNLAKFAEKHGLYKQKLKPYLDRLIKLNLIRIEVGSRESTLYLTDTGKVVKELI